MKNILLILLAVGATFFIFSRSKTPNMALQNMNFEGSWRVITDDPAIPSDLRGDSVWKARAKRERFEIVQSQEGDNTDKTLTYDGNELYHGFLDKKLGTSMTLNPEKPWDGLIQELRFWAHTPPEGSMPEPGPRIADRPTKLYRYQWPLPSRSRSDSAVTTEDHELYLDAETSVVLKHIVSTKTRKITIECTSITYGNVDGIAAPTTTKVP